MGIRGKKISQNLDTKILQLLQKFFFTYQIICEILMNYLKDAFGENLTPDGEEAWKKLLEILVATIDEKLFELQN